MSILIKGMEMPESCYECRMYEADIYYCATADRIIDIPDSSEARCTFCPLVPVPPHGRLCDLDALINKIGENIDKAKDRSYDWWYACTVAYDFALAAPTIIPAEVAQV